MKARAFSRRRALCVRHVRRRYAQYFPAGSLRSRLFGGVAWSVVGTAATRAISLATAICVARILGKQRYGELGVVQSTVGMFSILAGLGLGITATRFIAQLRESDPTRAGRILTLGMRVAAGSGVVMAIALVLSAPYLASHVLRGPEVAVPLALAGGILLFGALNGFQVGALAGFEAFRSIARTNVIAGLASFPATVIAVWLWGVRGAVASLGIAMALKCLFNGRALRQERISANVPIIRASLSDEWRTITHFSVPALLSGIVYSTATWAATAMLVRSPWGFAEMGLYNAANQWSTAVLLLPTMIAPVILAMLSNLHRRHGSANYYRLIKASLVANGAVAGVAAGVVLLFSSVIMRFYGVAFASGTRVLALLAVVSFLMAVNNVFVQFIASSGRMWTDFFFNVLWAVALMAFVAKLVPSYGAVGLATSLVLAYSFHTIWQGGYAFYVIRNRSPKEYGPMTEPPFSDVVLGKLQ